MASDAGSDGGPGASDPGIRLLTRVGNFVAPLTRFDRGHIALETSRSETVSVVLRQTFRASLEVGRSSGAGPLPGDALAAPDVAAAERDSEAQMRVARARLPPLLAEWTQARGDDPLRRPGVRDVFQPVPAVGHVAACASCNGAGKLACPGCAASGVVPCPACEARGSSPCKACQTTGKERCDSCYGLGYQIRDRQNGEQERIACAGCNGSGSTACETCHGRGRIICATCHGQKTTPCPQCRGAGSLACEACEGLGRRYTLMQLSGRIGETSTITSDVADPDVAAVLRLLASPEALMELANGHRTATETSGAILTRETRVSVPVTTITVTVAGQSLQIRGYGPRQIVRNYANVAGLLLAQDVERLASLTPSAMRFPPRSTPELEQAIGDVLASPLNATIVEGAAGAQQEAVEQRYSGGLTQAHVRRAGAVTRRAIATAYWAELAGRPALVLALPLLQFPLGLLLRGQGDASHAMATIGVMLLTLGGAIAAHMWCATQLQKRIAPSGSPRLGHLLDKLKLTRMTLIAAGAWAFVATLVVAGVTSALFPPIR